MNNRIMAMLFALVAAMFISIVPVKAEAAAPCDKHDVQAVEKIAAKEPTCNTPGNHKYYRCDDCGNVYSDSKCTISTTVNAQQIPAKGHKWTWAETETGHIQKCTVEGCTATQSGAAHSYTYKAVDGKCAGTCTCGKSVTVDHVDANKNGWCDNGCNTVMHDMVKIEAKAAECAKPGNIEHFYCKICTGAFADADGKTKLDDTSVKALEHKNVYKYDDKQHKLVCELCDMLMIGAENHSLKKVDNKNGTHTVTCETCKYEKTEAHDDGSKKDCVCGVCNAEMEHQLGEYTAHPSDESKHYRNCTVCRKTIVNEKCTFEYTQLEYGKNQHKHECSVCGRFKNTAACFDPKDDHYCDGCGGHMTHNVEADYMKTVHKAPTCTEDGIWLHYECKTCGLLIRNGQPFDGDKVNPATGHKFDATWTWYQTEDGTGHYKNCANGCETHVYGTAEDVKVGEELHTHDHFNVSEDAHEDVCAVCKQSYGYEKHEYTQVELAKASSTGTQRHKLVCECGASVLKKCEFDENCVCKICGDDKVHDIAALSTVPGAKDPTCTATGMKTHYKCNTCENIFFYENGKCVKINAQDTVIPALGHKWVAKGTDVADGKHVMKCENKGCTKYTVMPHYTEDGDCYCDVANCKEIAHSHKHVYVPAVSATCTEEGVEAYYYYQDCGRKFDLNEREISAPAKTPATGHDFGDEWIPCEGGVHAKFCANCDEFQSAEHTFANGNVQCSVCGGEEELTHVEAKAATCTETGNVEYWYSQITGKKYADAAGNKLLSDVTVAATGHEMSGWQDAANGIGHKQICMNTGCNHTLTANHDNANSCFCTECGGFKTGHAMEMKNAVPATCAKEGTQAYFKCSCGKMFDMGYNQIEAPVAIKALNHNYDNAKVQKDAKSGQHYVACADCGKKVYQDHAMQMSDPMKGNYHQYLCSCGELEIETHYDKNGDNKCDVCGHSMGGTQETTPVQQHDNKTVVTGQAGQTQSSNSWWQNWLEALTPGTSGGSTSTEKAPEANTSTGSNAAASGNTASSGNASTGNATTGNTNTGNSTGNGSTVSGGNASGSNTGSTSTAPAAPSVEQTSVIAQFITWFLGLFGF